MLDDCLLGKDLRGVVPGQGFRKRDGGEQELEGVKGVLETRDRRVCVQKTKSIFAGSKRGLRGSVGEREGRMGQKRWTGLARVKTLTFILGSLGRRQ